MMARAPVHQARPTTTDHPRRLLSQPTSSYGMWRSAGPV